MEQIFIKAQSGDALAFGELILPYEKLVYSIAARMLRSAEEAKDVSQEVWLKVYKNLDKCDGADSFKAWICVITHNACLDFLRKRKARVQTENIDSVFYADTTDGADLPEQEILRREARAQIENAIAKLPPNHKQAIIYRDIHGFSYDEIAKITGQNLGTVKSQISRARSALKVSVLKLREQEKI